MVTTNADQHIIVVSHQRSGTHLTLDSIINNLAVFSGRSDATPITIDRLSSHMRKTHPTLPEVLARMREGPTVFKSHTHGNVMDFFQGSGELSAFIDELFGRSKIIYVYRDGRDVMASLYHYMRHFDERVAASDFHDFLRMTNDVDAATYEDERDRPSYWAFHVESWLARSDVLRVSFEDLIEDHGSVLKRIGEFTEQPLVDNLKSMRRSRRGLAFLTEKLRRRMSIDFLTGRKYTSVAFRKGERGDWANHFSEDDVDFFEQRAGAAMRALSYR